MYHNMATLATYDLTSWEHGEKCAGVAFNWASCYCPFSAARTGTLSLSVNSRHMSSAFASSQHTRQMCSCFQIHAFILRMSQKLPQASIKKKKQLFGESALFFYPAFLAFPAPCSNAALQNAHKNREQPVVRQNQEIIFNPGHIQSKANNNQGRVLPQGVLRMRFFCCRWRWTYLVVGGEGEAL